MDNPSGCFVFTRAVMLWTGTEVRRLYRMT